MVRPDNSSFTLGTVAASIFPLTRRPTIFHLWRLLVKWERLPHVAAEVTRQARTRRSQVRILQGAPTFQALTGTVARPLGALCPILCPPIKNAGANWTRDRALASLLDDLSLALERVNRAPHAAR